MSKHILSDRDLDTIFRQARTHNGWAPTKVSAVQLHAIYDLMRMGPTGANCQPSRLVFCQSDESRARLAACVADGNKAKVLQAPVTVIIGMDMTFYERLPELFPHVDARSWFVGNEAVTRETAFRNSSMQAAYLIMAARSIGLDCGPMAGFDKAAIDQAFFAGTTIETNMICALGYGTEENLFPRNPRLSFEDAAQII